MSEVKRYTESCMEGGGVAPDCNGEFVEWKDYEKLRAELAGAQVLIAAIAGTIPLGNTIGALETGRTMVDYFKGLHTELAALKAGQGEAVAWEYRVFHGDDTVTPGWDRWERVEARYASETVASRVKEIQGYIGQGYRYELRALYTTPAASADAVSVPRELMERIVEHVEYDAIGSPSEVIAGDLVEELRALLAQSESKEVKP